MEYAGLLSMSQGSAENSFLLGGIFLFRRRWDFHWDCKSPYRREHATRRARPSLKSNSAPLVGSAIAGSLETAAAGKCSALLMPQPTSCVRIGTNGALWPKS